MTEKVGERIGIMRYTLVMIMKLCITFMFTSAERGTQRDSERESDREREKYPANSFIKQVT